MIDNAQDKGTQIVEAGALQRALVASIAELSLDFDAAACVEQLRMELRALTASPRSRKQLDEAFRQVAAASRPDVLFRAYGVQPIGQGLLLHNQRLNGPRLPMAFRHCSLGVVFVVSLGEAIDALIQAEFDDGADRGYLFDQVASRYAEHMAEQAQQRLAWHVPAPLGLTARYSPGYCGWPLQEQRRLFALLPSRPLGVELSPECLMTPRKSIAGILGIGPADMTARHGNACRHCPQRACDHRRMPPGA